MKSQKEIYLIIGIAILVLVGLSGYYLSKQSKPLSIVPTPATSLTETVNSTSDWKTYTNTQYGYSLKYPTNYFIFQQGNTLGFFVATSAPNGGNGPKFLGENDVWLSAFSTKSTLTLDQYVTTQQSVVNSVYKNLQKKSVIIDGVSGYKIIYSYQVFPTGNSSNNTVTSITIYSSDYWVMKDGMLYTISLSSFKKNLLDNQQTMFDQILTSFKFIVPITSTDTSNWTVYTNKTFGYSLKFPATYQVPPQTDKEKSQLGVDNNIAVVKKSDSIGSSVIVIDVNTVIDVNFYNGMSFEDYMNKNLKMYGIIGPLVKYNFNGYDSLSNKNQPGTNIFVKQGQNVYHIIASTASSDKEVGDIVSTFKFTQ